VGAAPGEAWVGGCPLCPAGFPLPRQREGAEGEGFLSVRWGGGEIDPSGGDIARRQPRVG